MTGGGGYQRDLRLRLGTGFTLTKPEDYDALVSRVEVFCSVALTNLDDDAKKRVLASVVLDIIAAVPPESPHGRLMMSMIQGINRGTREEREAWQDHLPATATEVTDADRASVMWSPGVPISKPLYRLLKFWAVTLGAVEQGAKRAHTAIVNVLGCVRGKMSLPEFVERMRNHLRGWCVGFGARSLPS